MLETLILAVILLWFIIARQRANDRRFAALEAQVAELRAALAGTQPMPAAAAVAEVEIVAEEPVAEAEAPVSVAASETAEPVAEAEPAPETSGDTLESWLGARWAVWVGGIALALGGIFLAKYSIESGLLSASVRLSLAALFGLVLFAAGEIVRRRALPQQPRAFANALIPGVLTAAGAVTLFGTVYVAYAFYGFFGPATAFMLLAVVGLVTLALSLLHGQALAGLGLLGSMLTPALIASTAPSIWALFSFLTFSWVATALAARLRRWTLVPALGNLGLCLWALAYIVNAGMLDIVPLTLSLLCLIAGLTFLWPGTADFARPEPAPAPTDNADAPEPRSRGAWESLLTHPPLGLTISGAFAVLLPALALVAMPAAATFDPALCFAVLIVTLAAWGASRLNAQWAALLAATGAVCGVAAQALSGLVPLVIDLPGATSGVPLSYATEMAVSLGLGLAFVLLGLAFLLRHGAAQPQMATLWAALMAIVPVANGAVSLVNFGNLYRDLPHGLYGLAIAAALLAIAELQSRRADARGGAMHWLVGGGFFALLLALQALTNGIYTIVGVAIAGYAFVLANRWRVWPALPWMMAVACFIVLARIAVDPTIVGPESLGTTPVFNALAIGYGLPALLAALSAYHLRHWPDLRLRNLMQALASLMVFLTVAILLRHAMHGGRLASDTPTLGEQSIYTLLTIGMAIVLMSLDFRSPSPVFRYGSMIVGALSMVSVLTTHLIVLNPYLTGEDTGRWPFFNLLLLGYLLPGIAYGGLAAYARNRRPRGYVVLAAISAAVLGFVWATLGVRRYWQGSNIADWKGFLESETYTYSVVWLLIGIGLLGLGSRFDAKSLRLASAALVMIAVLKVFLVDMANLEGVLRALSFIGLGIVLIGIGLFYQRILGNRGRAIAPERRGG